MSARSQIVLATLLFGALLWVAYASVNVVFKEQIIVAKERDFRVMQTMLTARIHDSRKAYDDVSALNALINQNFEEIMAELTARNHRMEAVVGLKRSLDAQVEGLAEGLSAAGGPNGQRLNNANRVMVDAIGRDATPRQSRMPKLRRATYDEALKESALVTGGREDSLSRMRRAAAALEAQQIALLAAVQEDTQRKIAELSAIIDTTGISSSSLVARSKIDNPRQFGQGGPFIDAFAVDDAESTFFQQAEHAALYLDDLVEVGRALQSVPLSTPVSARHRFTSGFGFRRDPMNGRVSRHFGVDFAGPWASDILSTAEGTISYAGYRSGYGRCVEVDHGNGFMTRYAHLHKISVKKGDKVALRGKIGELGSSGRSTGPHLHYEVHYNGAARDPMRFIGAGRYVFES